MIKKFEIQSKMSEGLVDVFLDHGPYLNLTSYQKLRFEFDELEDIYLTESALTRAS